MKEEAMNERNESIWCIVWVAVWKAALWVGAWVASVKAERVQVWVSIASGILVGALAGANLYVTWRDKIRRNGPSGTHPVSRGVTTDEP